MGARLLKSVGWCGALLALLAVPIHAADLTLKFSEPAAHVAEALPLGDGRLGTMVFGGISNEVISISRCVGPAGVETLAFGEAAGATDYERSLDLERAVATVRYRLSGATFTREVFCSYPDHVTVMRLTCDLPGRLHFSSTRNDRLGRVVLMEGGTITNVGEVEVFTNGTAFTLCLSANTSVNASRPGGDEPGPAVLTPGQMSQKNVHAYLMDRHEADYQKLFRQVDLYLGTAPGVNELPLPERLRRVADGKADPGLAVLFFQYARYLLITRTHSGDLPFPEISSPASTDGNQAWSALKNQLGSIVIGDTDCEVNSHLLRFAGELSEMLLQSDGGEKRKAESGKAEAGNSMPTIDLLPALPGCWPYGHVTGLRAAGGFLVDMEWKTGRVVAATIRSTGGTDFEVRTGSRVKQYRLKRGRSIILDAGLEKWSE